MASTLQDLSDRQIVRFSETNPRFAQHLLDAIGNYIDGNCPYYLLFDVLSLGHRQFKDFLASMNYSDPASPATIGAYWDELKKHNSTYPELDAALLTRSFEGPLRLQSLVLDDFLSKSITISNITLAHGVMTHAPENYSIAVNTRDFLANFIQGHATQYRTPLSTSASAAVAMQFATHADMEDVAPTAFFDITDNSPANQARRLSLLDEVNQIGPNSVQSPALVHFFRCNNARGSWLSENAVEQEVLLAKNHVSTPKYLLQGPEYFILVSDLRYGPPMSTTPMQRG